MVKRLIKKELIKKIESLNKIYKKNESLKMYEACIKNMQLIHKYEYDLKELKKGPYNESK